MVKEQIWWQRGKQAMEKTFLTGLHQGVSVAQVGHQLRELESKVAGFNIGPFQAPSCRIHPQVSGPVLSFVPAPDVGMIVHVYTHQEVTWNLQIVNPGGLPLS